MNNLQIKKIVVSLIFLTLAIVAIAGWVDEKGVDYTNATFKRALTAFGIAKGLNGVISVAQGTEVALQPAGIGINFTPGQILDPVNDVIEQFSWIMLASTASIGIQKVLLIISQWTWFSYIVAVLLLLSLASYWYRPLAETSWKPILFKTMLLFVFLRFSVPLIAICSEVTYQQFLAEQYTESAQELEQTTEKITDINKSSQPVLPADNTAGFVDKIRQMYGSAAAAIDIDARIERYKTAAAEATEHVINLIVVFVFQTVLLPVLFLLIIYRFLKQLIRLEWMKI